MLMTVKEVSNLTGVSIRTLQYYDKIGLLPASSHTDAGYRLYDDTALERLQQILLFKELKFSLKDIKNIVNDSQFDRDKALEQQIELLTMKRNHLNNLINFAQKIKCTGVKKMDFKVFDTTKMDEYTNRAKKEWGETLEFREYEEKARKQDSESQRVNLQNLMLIFTEFNNVMDKNPEDIEAQLLVKKLKDFISENFYKCSNEVLSGLGTMYSSGGEFTENIDSYAGEGTADFVSRAIEIYCK